MKAVHYSQAMEKTKHTTKSQNPKDNHNLNNHCENLKFYNGNHTQCGLSMKTVTANCVCVCACACACVCVCVCVCVYIYIYAEVTKVSKNHTQET